MTLSGATKAFLVLDDGRIFEGMAWGATGKTFGEAVFATGMTGYQETLTDPSYHKQVVVMTSPHVGNTGWNLEDNESSKIWVSGFVVRNPSPIVSNWRANSSLESELIRQNIVGIQGVDTRALTRHLRDRGAMRVGIFSGEELSREEMVIEVRKMQQMSGSFLSEDVSTSKSYVIGSENHGLHVVALDLGIKAATPKTLANKGVKVTVVPFDSTKDEILAHKPDGIFLSNGPGDPAAMDSVVETIRELLQEEIPLFGICFGHQLLGRALGFETYKLQFGHRGINQPVLDKLTGKVEITAHNHGFALKAPTEGIFTTVFGRGEVTHVGLNDGVVEGLRLIDRPAFSVQYHPEAAAGPHDASYLFDRFIDLIRKSKLVPHGN